MTDRSRVYVRVKPESQAVFSQAADKANLRGASAMTLVLEAFATHLAKDGDFLMTMAIMKRAFEEDRT